MYDNANPSPEELAQWLETARQRNAILPNRIEMRGRYIHITCSIPECHERFSRKLLPGRNDPVYVCPRCRSRIYIPVEW